MNLETRKELLNAKQPVDELADKLLQIKNDDVPVPRIIEKLNLNHNALEQRYSQLVQEVDELKQEKQGNNLEIDLYNQQLILLLELKKAALIANIDRDRCNEEHKTDTDASSYVSFILEINKCLENNGIEIPHINHKINQYKNDFPEIYQQVYRNSDDNGVQITEFLAENKSSNYIKISTEKSVIVSPSTSSDTLLTVNQVLQDNKSQLKKIGNDNVQGRNLSTLFDQNNIDITKIKEDGNAVDTNDFLSQETLQPAVAKPSEIRDNILDNVKLKGENSSNKKRSRKHGGKKIKKLKKIQDNLTTNEIVAGMQIVRITDSPVICISNNEIPTVKQTPDKQGFNNLSDQNVDEISNDINPVAESSLKSEEEIVREETNTEIIEKTEVFVQENANIKISKKPTRTQIKNVAADDKPTQKNTKKRKHEGLLLHDSLSSREIVPGRRMVLRSSSVSAISNKCKAVEYKKVTSVTSSRRKNSAPTKRVS